MALTVVEKMVEKIAKTPIKVEESLCSRFRTTRSNCRRCVEFCPFPEAIRLTEQGVEVNENCIGCGVCYSACPNGALLINHQGDDQSLEGLVQGILKGRPDGIIRISCQQGDSPADITVPCLGRLTETLILESFHSGASKVEFLKPPCVECPLQKAATYVESLLSRITSFCEFVKKRMVQTTVPLKLWTEENRAKPQCARPVERSLSRRDFLSVFRKEATATAVAAASAAIPDLNSSQKLEGELFREKINAHHTNMKRKHLLEILSNFSMVNSVEIPSRDAPFGEIEVNSQCMGCNVCQTLCPVGAIQRKDDNSAFVLDFHPELCTNCQVCAVACLPKAIHVKEHFNFSLLKQEVPSMLI